MRWRGPTVGFAIWHEGKLVDQWRAATSEQRIADVLGDDFITESRPFALSMGPLALTGRAGPARSRALAGRPAIRLGQRPLCA